MKTYILEITVFITGTLVMVLEVIGSRVVAPYLGTSLIVWTSLIGVVLASLSLGYYWGGRIADRKPAMQTLGGLILLAGVSVALLAALYHPFLTFIQNTHLDLRWQTLIGTFTLFVAPSTLLGMVSPYAAKLRLSNLNESGATVGNLYAISTLGSILGTFLTGFVLITWLGTDKILILVAAVLILTGILLLPHWKVGVAAMLAVTFFSSLTLLADAIRNKEDQLVDIDTPYSRVWIYPSTWGADRQPILQLSIGSELSSARYLNSTELVYDYTRRYRLARHFVPNLNNALMLGGAGYSYPQDFLRQYPNAYMDVVEIDPRLTELAKQYFNLLDNPRLTNINQDGRTFLNTTSKKYDVIYGDAFKSVYSIPYQLTTKEAVQKMYSALNSNGVLMVNVISALEGPANQFLQAEIATVQSVFPQVYILPVEGSSHPNKTHNVMLVALKSPTPPSWTDTDPELQSYLNERWQPENFTPGPVLTDNFAPVDFYALKALLN